MTPVYLGVDAGNSKTAALVVDSDGNVRGRGRGGVGDIYGVPTEELAVDAVVATVEAALSAAEVRPADVAAAAFRLAGVDWPEDETFWSAALTRRLPGLGRTSTKNDGFALLRCGDSSGVGVAVTVGTGPAVAARGGDGREHCACWWIQHSLGGHALGRAAFRAVIDAEIGLGPATALKAELLDLFAYPDVTSLLHAFTHRGSLRSDRDKRVAARSVLRCAGEGDAVAAGIVEAEARTFAGLARVAAEQVDLVATGRPVPVVLGGSILTSEHPAYRAALVSALADELGVVAVASTAASPVAGAVLDALAEGGVGLDQGLHDRVLHASHPSDFLLT